MTVTEERDGTTDPFAPSPFVEGACEVGGCACGIWADWLEARTAWARAHPEAAAIEAIADDDDRCEAYEDFADERGHDFERLAPPCPRPGCARHAPHHDVLLRVRGVEPTSGDLLRLLREAGCEDATVSVAGGETLLDASVPGADGAAAAARAITRLAAVGLEAEEVPSG